MFIPNRSGAASPGIRPIGKPLTPTIQPSTFVSANVIVELLDSVSLAFVRIQIAVSINIGVGGARMGVSIPSENTTDVVLSTFPAA